MAHHGPPWLWTLPNALRPATADSLWQQVDHLLTALHLQSRIAPFVAESTLAGPYSSLRGTIALRWLPLFVTMASTIALLLCLWRLLGLPAIGGAALAFAALGLAVVLYQHVHRSLRIHATPQSVTLHWRTAFLCSRQLDCPLDDYLGIARWSGSVQRHLPLYSWAHRWWMVVLVHRHDPSLSVPLAVARQSAGLPHVQHQAADLLGLPVLLERPGGQNWQRYPAHTAELGLLQSLGLSLPLAPVQHRFPATTLRSGWGEIRDRWLILLFVLPVGAFWGGPLGLLVAALLPVTVWALHWRYWHKQDGWTCDGQTLTLTIGSLLGRDKTVAIPLEHILAIRPVPGIIHPPTVEIETALAIWSLRTGTASRGEIQKAIADLITPTKVVWQQPSLA